MSSTFVTTPGWLDWDPEPSTPTLALPVGTVDAHCHVFGPGDEFPFAPERKYTPCDAGKEQLFALRDRLGVSRNVIVQATCHGADNRAMVDAVSDAMTRWGEPSQSPEPNFTSRSEMRGVFASQSPKSSAPGSPSSSKTTT